MTKRIVGMALLALGVAGWAAGTTVPEIDPGTAGNGLALLAGVLLILNSRRSR